MSNTHHSLTTNGEQSFVVDETGFVLAFGLNAGHLGIGGGMRDQIERQSTPAQVHNIEQIVSVSIGGVASQLNLFLTEDGKIYGVGRLSEFDNIDEPKLVQWTNVPNNTVWKVISAGKYGHQLFIRDDGSVWSAGTNTHAERGYVDNRVDYFKITRFIVPEAVDAVAGVYMSLVIDVEGKVWSCGLNESGQCGIPGPDHITRPTIVPGLPKIVMIAVGSDYSAFLDEQGQIWVCGDRDPTRQRGDPLPRDVANVKMIPGIIGARYISSSDYNTYFIGQDGYAYVFGLNNVPKRIEGASNLVEIAGGTEHLFTGSDEYLLAIDSHGRVWSRGSNRRGQLGLGQDSKYVATNFELIPGIRAKLQSSLSIEEVIPFIEITYPVFEALINMGFEFGIVEQNNHGALVEIIDGDNNHYRTRIGYDNQANQISPPMNGDDGFKHLEEAIKNGLEDYVDREDILIKGGQAIEFVDTNGQHRIIAVVSAYGQVFPYPSY